MPDRSKRLLEAAGMLLILALTAVVLYVLLLYPGDISAQQTENRKIFGATYMTMNNPYYHVLDSQLRAEIEARGMCFSPGTPQWTRCGRIRRCGTLLRRAPRLSS